MNNINGAALLAAVICGETETARRRLALDSHLPKPNLSNRQPADNESRHAPQRELQETIAQRIRQISPEDPRRAKKALRVFLESVLVAEFGQQLINDPAFFQVIDAVQSSMEEDPSLSEPIRAAMTSLLDVPT